MLYCGKAKLDAPIIGCQAVTIFGQTALGYISKVEHATRKMLMILIT